jgi:hypothetical protein
MRGPQQLVLLGCATPGGWSTDLATCTDALPQGAPLTLANYDPEPLPEPEPALCGAPALRLEMTSWPTFDVAMWPPQRAEELIAASHEADHWPTHDQEQVRAEQRALVAELALAGGVAAPEIAALQDARGYRDLDVDLDGDGALDALWTLLVYSSGSGVLQGAVVGQLSSLPGPPRVLFKEEPVRSLELQAAIDLNGDGRWELVFSRHSTSDGGGGLTTYQDGKLVVSNSFFCAGPGPAGEYLRRFTARVERRRRHRIPTRWMGALTAITAPRCAESRNCEEIERGNQIDCAGSHCHRGSRSRRLILSPGGDLWVRSI